MSELEELLAALGELREMQDALTVQIVELSNQPLSTTEMGQLETVSLKLRTAVHQLQAAIDFIRGLSGNERK